MRLWSSGPSQLAVKKATNKRDHLVGLVFQGEMAGVDHVQLGIRQIAQVRLGSIGGKYRVVFAPDDEGRRLTVPKECLKFRIEWHVGTIVMHQIHLDIQIA